MAKKRTKPARSKASKKFTSTPRKGVKHPKRKKPRPVAPPAAIEPSHIRPAVTARRMGRPTKLTRGLIAEFMGHLSLGLHLSQCAALVGLSATQVSDYLKDGRKDADAGKRTIAADFSEEVRERLAALQQKELGSLEVYQRMAEGWSPTCKRCLAKGSACGRHPKNLRLAASLSQWRLVHRFPKEWNVSHVRHGVDDDGAETTTTPGEGGKTGAGALVIFMPTRQTQ